MFSKSRKKIVAAIMSVLVLLWVSTLGIIYGSSYFELRERNRQMLMAHAQAYTLQQEPGLLPPGKPQPGGGRHDFVNTPSFMLSTFYTVALSYGGEVLEIRNSQPSVHTDAELEELARLAIEKKSSSGTRSSLVYYTLDKGGYRLVTFVDNTILHESMTTLFRYTLIFGGLAILAFFFLAVFLARKIVQPLEESYRRQRQFISDAGHELKTPVSVVSANAELLARELGENRWLDNIRYENQRMGLLVSQLLELARTEAVRSQRQSVELSRLVRGEALPFECVAFEKGLSLCCDIRDGILTVGDPEQLKQLVSILLDNAIRHTEPGNTVTLTLTEEHGSIRLSVSNPGQEIPRDQRARLFERFYRRDTARSAEDGNYGLGLAIAKAIVTAHHGHIEVLCPRDTVEFRVKLPTA